MKNLCTVKSHNERVNDLKKRETLFSSHAGALALNSTKWVKPINNELNLIRLKIIIIIQSPIN